MAFNFNNMSPIGIFDSGYGGLTVLRSLRSQLLGYDFLYLGDNARTPYGTRSFKTVYEYTKQCVQWMLDQGCPLVILACNTASAKALRTIQQKDLPVWNSDKRILGVVRPTAEVIGNFSKNKEIGILATKGTVASGSYLIEIENFFPALKVYQQACPLWVPLIENNEIDTEGAAYFIKRDAESLLAQSSKIDTILLGCTHYPLLMNILKEFLPENVKLVSQGPIVANALEDYLDRHPEIKEKCSKESTTVFYTTDSPEDFDQHSLLFYGEKTTSRHVHID